VSVCVLDARLSSNRESGPLPGGDAGLGGAGGGSADWRQQDRQGTEAPPVIDSGRYTHTGFSHTTCERSDH